MEDRGREERDAEEEKGLGNLRDSCRRGRRKGRRRKRMAIL